MAIEKLDFKFTNQVRRDEQVKKLAEKVNEIVDGTNPLIDHISYDSTNSKVIIDNDLDLGENDLSCENVNVGGTLNLQSTQSAKKIYCHPVWISGSGKNFIQFLIFNNSSTAFETVSDLFDYIDQTDNARYLVTGMYNSYEVVMITSGNQGDSSIQIILYDDNSSSGRTTDTVSKVAFTSTFANIYDTVHAIN